MLFIVGSSAGGILAFMFVVWYRCFVCLVCALSDGSEINVSVMRQFGLPTVLTAPVEGKTVIFPFTQYL